MTDGQNPTPSCNLCCHWAPNLEGKNAQEGICQVLAQDPAYYGSLMTDAGDRCDAWAGLGVFQGDDGKMYLERRTALRTRIDLPATLHTTSGDQPARLADISKYGAGVRLSNPPPAGTPGILKWRSYEVFFSVAWENADSCGVMFDAPISDELVLETVRHGALENNRPAQPSRIAQGQKRVNPWASV